MLRSLAGRLLYDATTTEDWDVAQAQADIAAQHIQAAAGALKGAAVATV